MPVFLSNDFLIVDPTDQTKALRFGIAGVGTSSTATLTIPNASDTVVLLATFQTITNKVVSISASNLQLAAAGGGQVRLLGNAVTGLADLQSPNASGTIALIDLAQTWTALQTFAAITATDLNAISYDDDAVFYEGEMVFG
jgi:hypothetical protein